MKLIKIQREVNDDTEKWFPSTKDDVCYLGLCLAGEVGEVLNHIKKYERGSKNMAELRMDAADELADVLIYLAMLANALEVDLAYEYDRKRVINEARFSRD